MWRQAGSNIKNNKVKDMGSLDRHSGNYSALFIL
jgi:hypothetical protein